MDKQEVLNKLNSVTGILDWVSAGMYDSMEEEPNEKRQEAGRKAFDLVTEVIEEIKGALV